MTILDGPSPLAIMARPDIREASEAGYALLALAPTLDRVLWSNTAAASLLGLTTSDAMGGARELPLAAARQIAAAARPVRERGAARILLRPSAALLKPVVADLDRKQVGEAEGEASFILLSIPAKAVARTAAERGRLLIEEAGAGAAAAAIFEDGTRLAATERFPDGLSAELAAALADFEAAGEDFRPGDAAAGSPTLARVARSLVLVEIADPAAVAVSENAADASPERDETSPDETADGPEETSPPVGAFSVKRGKLPPGRRKIDMSALIARWHTRQHGPEDAGPGRLRQSEADEVASALLHDATPQEWGVPNLDETAPLPGAKTEPESGEAASESMEASASARAETVELPSAEETGDGRPDASEAAAPRPVRLRSRWGEPPASEAPEAAAGPEASPADAFPAADRPGGISTEALPETGGDAAAALDEAATTQSDDLAPVAEDGAGSLPAEASDEPSEAAPAAGGAASAAPESVAAASAGTRFLPEFHVAPVRFAWQIDSEGRFRSLSPEFAAAVGPVAADVVGRSFREVAQVFDFDPDGDIARLLGRRDTWSGRSIFWPVEASDRKVPVDLAALPIYGRDRAFDGFRGFGIIRMSEWITDPEAIGMILSGEAPALPANAGAAPDDEMPDDDAADRSAAALGDPTRAEGEPMKPVLTTFHAERPGVPFGRRSEPPSPPDEAPSPALPKVIQLEERRRPKDAALSHAEEAAFLAIGQKLADGRAGETGTPDGAGDDIAGSPPDAASSQADEAEPADLDDSLQAPAADEASEVPADAVDLPAGLETVFASLPLPVLIQQRDRLAYANREFFDLTGYQSLGALRAAGGLEALFADEQSQIHDGETTVRRSNGDVRTVRAHLQKVSMAGRSCLLMSFSPSPRESAEAARGRHEDPALLDDLLHEVEELQAVLDTATDGIVLLDAEGAIRGMNGSAQALFGIKEEDVVGRHVSTLFAHESRKATIDYLEMLKDNGLAGILNDGREVVGRVAQGGLIPLFITMGRLSGERGWCVVIRDIAHWKRIEEELVNARSQAEAASLHKSQFLANISHELRTPLNAIIGFADVMSTECFGPIGNERYLEYLADIKRSGHHVLDLVNDLLDISKIEAGKLDLAFEAVALNEVVAEIVSLMQPQATRERVIVRSNLPASVPPVVADRRSVRQIALNLVSNAIRFTPAGGQIIASTAYTAEGDVVLRFRDSGIGMSEREIEIALTPFQQVHAPGKGRGEGTGLGLPLTKAMVEANKAHFQISSTPGEGTLVEIVFPSQRVLAD